MPRTLGLSEGLVGASLEAAADGAADGLDGTWAREDHGLDEYRTTPAGALAGARAGRCERGWGELRELS